MKTYKIDKELTAYQDELTLEQDAKLAELLSDVNLDNVESLTMKDLLKALTTKGVLLKFFSIILTDNAGKPLPESVLSRIKNNILLEVINDFFSLNKDLMQMLKSLLPPMARETLSTSHTSDTGDISHP